MSKDSFLIWFSEWIFCCGFWIFLRFRNMRLPALKVVIQHKFSSPKNIIWEVGGSYKLIYVKEGPFWILHFKHHHPSHLSNNQYICWSRSVGGNSFWIYQSKNVFLHLELLHICTLQLTHGFRQPYTGPGLVKLRRWRTSSRFQLCVFFS